MKSITGFSRLLSLAIFLIYSSITEGQIVAPKEGSTVYKPVKNIPAEGFFENPERTGFKISPDGKHLAFYAPFKGHMNLCVQPINGGDVALLTMHTEKNIEAFEWLNNETLVYLFDKNKDGNNILYSAKMGSSEGTQVTSDGTDARFLRLAPFNMNSFSFEYKYEGTLGYDLCRFDPLVAGIETIGRNTGSIDRWYMSFDGNTIVAVERIKSEVKLVKLIAEREFAPIASFQGDGILQPLLFDVKYKGAVLVLSNYGRKHAQVVRYDTNTAKEVDVAFQKENADITGFVLNRTSTLPLAYSYNGDKPGIVYYDRQFELVNEAVREKLGAGRTFECLGMDLSNNVYLVKTTGHLNVPTYHAYNYANKELKMLESINPMFSHEMVADVKASSFKNRRGKTVNGFYTAPSVGGNSMPLILMLPEWPGSAVTLEFDPEIQFLANKGYAVYQMDYAGSSEYGSIIQIKGYSEWGQLLLDDVADAAKYLIKSGIAHPDKVVVMGKSFGGYLASVSLASNPELFSGAIFINGIFDIGSLKNSNDAQKRNQSKYLSQLVRDPQTDGAQLDSKKMANNYKSLTAPMMFAYTINDEVVPPSQTEELTVALAKVGVTTETIYLEDFHEIQKLDTKVNLWNAVRDFMQNHYSSNEVKRTTPSEEEMRRRKE